MSGVTQASTLLDLAASKVPGMPAWLEAIRVEARQRALDLGLPTRRDEEWRFTNLRALESTSFVACPNDGRGEPTRAQLDPLRFEGLSGTCLVFVNGRYSEALSSPQPLPDGVAVLRFADAFVTHAELLESHLTRYAAFAEDAFTAINTARLEDGVLVHVAGGVVVDEPITILNLTSASDGAVATHPRHLVVAESGSRVTVVEDYASLTEDAYLTNAVTEIAVGANARVDHYFLERESEHAFHINTLKVHQERDSRFASHSVLMGGAIVRNNVNPVLAGEGCHSLLNGLYVGRDRQLLDNHMRVEHSAAHCDSRQYYKGILNDRSHGVFSGRIVVAEGAQKTDAVQSNANLLMSEDAQAQVKPQLEIYADDVKCTHGATIGQLDDEAIFYLRSRGMSNETARSLLVHAFAGECLERMELDPIRQRLERDLLSRLPQATHLEAALV